MIGLLGCGRKGPEELRPGSHVPGSGVPQSRTQGQPPLSGRMVRLGDAETGLWEAARTFLKRHISHEQLDEQVQHIRRWAVQSDVMRDAIVNALVHRDYLLSGTTVELSVYKDRVEVILPSRFPNSFTPERMRAGCRASRNQLIKDTMLDYGYMEHGWLGVPRKIKRVMKLDNGTEPELIPVPDHEQFILKLFR